MTGTGVAEDNASMRSEGRRIQWLDLARALAIVSVVLCHATETVYSISPEGIASLPLLSRIICFTCFTCGRLGVPIFFMMTGYLLLPRDYDEEGVRRFWRERWLHLLVCTLVWFALYDVFLHFLKPESVSLLSFAGDMLFLHKVDLSHVWYLPVILGLYVLLPFVAKVLNSYDSRMFLFPLALFALYAFGVPTANVLCQGRFTLSNQLSLGFSGGAYGLYIVFGYFIRKGALRRGRIGIAVLPIVAFFLTVIMQIWSYGRGYGYNVWYDNILLLVTSVCLFELVSRLGSVPCYNIVHLLSAYSFPIYLVHNLVKFLSKDAILAVVNGRTAQVLALWMVCLTVSLMASALIGRTKVGRYLLYMK